VHRFGNAEVIFFHGGFGKVSAAASTQYAISRWHPHLVVNLGTCGGFGAAHKVGDVVLATKTVIYDIVEQMGDSEETIRGYTTTIDPSAWPPELVQRTSREPIVSGDRDLVLTELPALATKYGAGVGDWESGAIAWTARKNATAVLILRTVSDMVDAPGGDATYGDDAAWQREAARAMTSLLDLFESVVPALAGAPYPRAARTTTSRVLGPRVVASEVGNWRDRFARVTSTRPWQTRPTKRFVTPSGTCRAGGCRLLRARAAKLLHSAPPGVTPRLGIGSYRAFRSAVASGRSTSRPGPAARR
jgi:adenosylhomocysteine nucleosidase